MDFDGTNLKQLTDGKNKDFSEISRNGKWIYFADNGLWKMPVEGGEAIRIMKETPGRVHFSPTRPNIFSAYFYDDRDKKKDTWMHVVFNTDKLPEYKDLKIEPVDLFDWMPDGRKIYFVDGGESFNNIWTISPETLETERITNFQDQRISNMSLSPDGKTIAVSRGSAIGNILKISGYN